MTIRVVELSKAFGGAVALAGVDLTINPGEIHALLGPNGAGKSTLIKCIGGGIRPDSGKIWIDGAEYDGLTPSEAIAAGVAVIYQNLSLIGSLTVAENIFLGSEPVRGPFIRRQEQRQKAVEILQHFDVQIDPDIKVSDIPIASQQLVEIAKALHRTDVRLLILDEPTAALTENEAHALARRLRLLKDQGVHILYITHLLKEVFEVADRVTVLRDGRVVWEAPVAETSYSDLITAIAPSAKSTTRDAHREDEGEPMLEVRDLAGPRFGPISLSLRAGEILSVFGMLGSGRTELLETLFGVRRRERGTILLRSEPLTVRSPAEAIAVGIALVPAERLKQSILLSLSALDNLLLPSFGRLSVGGIRRKWREQNLFASAANRLQLHPPRPDLRARDLSGGTQQKVVVGRWLEAMEGISVLLLDEPTTGIDVGARREIYDIMRQTVRSGQRAILFTSSDPEEVVAVADRAIIVDRGQIVGELKGTELNEDTLLSVAYSAGPEHLAAQR
jgi:ribose transport system ATP-binding protein